MNDMQIVYYLDGKLQKKIYFFKCKKKDHEFFFYFLFILFFLDHEFLKANLNLFAYFLFAFHIGIFIFFNN